MRVIHAGGFSKNERKQWRVVIFNNLVNAFQILIGAMDEHGTDFENEENQVGSRRIVLRSASLTDTRSEIRRVDPV